MQPICDRSILLVQFTYSANNVLQVYLYHVGPPL